MSYREGIKRRGYIAVIDGELFAWVGIQWYTTRIEVSRFDEGTLSKLDTLHDGLYRMSMRHHGDAPHKIETVKPIKLDAEIARLTKLVSSSLREAREIHPSHERMRRMKRDQTNEFLSLLSFIDHSIRTGKKLPEPRSKRYLFNRRSR